MIFKAKKGLGYLPNPIDRRDLDIDVLALSTTDLPAEVSLAPYVSEVFDQGSTSSCVSNAIAGAIGILECKAEMPYKPVSRLFAYYNSRRLHNGHKSDSGTYIRTCLKMMTKLGIPDEEHWNFSTAFWKVNRRPPWNSYMMAHPRKDGTYCRIYDVGERRVLAIKAALAASLPVVFGTKVSRSYLESEGPTEVSRPSIVDEIAGGHAQVIVGYEDTESDGTRFRILNSWGDDWRDGGFIWMSEDYLTWDATRDLQIIKGWSSLIKAKGLN
jgi:C1A family cysteine protease